MAIAAAIPCGQAPGATPPARTLAVPAGRLDDAVVAIGTQAGVTIGIADPRLAALPVAGLRGRLSVAAALRRLLAGSGAGVVAIDAVTYRIVAVPGRRDRAPTAAPPVAAPIATASADAIVVTGSKRAALLRDYPGSVQVVEVATIRSGRLALGSDALLAAQPVLSATHLGPGRNKLFIRGIADSSFNGQTAATVGQYLGETRLNYNAPDPDLALYDMTSVELLEGPQGTLYGAGSLGGIIRLVPHAPDLDHASLDLLAGIAATARGDPGGDAAVIVDLPIVAGRLALRGVVYATRDGGYIDDRARGLTDINRTTTRGGRATLRFQPASDWTIDLGGVVQEIDSRDGQYDQRGLPPLTRATVLSQPFDNDYALASVVVRHAIGATDLVSATSGVFHDVRSSFDASPSPAMPVRYAEDDGITLLTNETRLSHHGMTGGGWVAGIELLHSADRLTRTLGAPDAATRIAGTRNTVEEASVYGEATLPLAARLFATGGGRIAYDRSVGEELDATGGDEPRRHDVSLLPSAGLLWRAAPRLSVYARYQKGYRSGGLSVQADGVQRFEPDSLETFEFGIRRGEASDRLSFSAAASYAHWRNIQADLVAADGLPYTDNIGTGRILGFELQSRWRPVAALTLSTAVFVARSRLSHPAAGFEGERDASLPNIANVVAIGGARYRLALLGRAIDLDASIQYVGRSRLGVGTLLDIEQGRYLDSSAGLSVPFEAATVSLDVTNLADVHGNLFALGDPFGVATGDQRTPLRPRTVRLGIVTHF